MKLRKRCIATALCSILILACLPGTLFADNTGQAEAAPPVVDDANQGDPPAVVPPVDDANQGDPPAVVPPVDDANQGDPPAVVPPVDDANQGDPPAVVPPVDDANQGDAPAVVPPVDDAGQGDAPAVEPPVDDANQGDLPAVEQQLPVDGAGQVVTLGQEDLQALVNGATGTLTLVATETYTGAIINKELTIEGNGAAISGTVKSTAPLVLKNLTINSNAAPAVEVSRSLDMQNCTVSGGVSITDNAAAQIKLFKNTLHYNTAGGNAAITVTAGEVNGSNHQDRYKIGGEYPQDNPSVLKATANTFINDGNGDGYAIIWPFFGNNGVNQHDRLKAYASYWKTADGRDMLFHEVKVGDNIQYANEILIKYKDGPEYGYVVPPENFAYRKGGITDRNGTYIPNTRDENVEAGDYALLLFDRSFKTNGTSVPLFYYFDIEQIYSLYSGDPTALDPPRRIQFLYANCYPDSNYGKPYSAEELENLKISNDGGLYWKSFYPVLPLDITPESMVSYAGTTQSLSADFPRVWYDFQAPNLFYDPADSTKGAEFIRMENPNTLGSTTTISYLKTKLKNPTGTYAPSLSADGIWSGYDPTLDPDKDFFPFLPAFLTGAQQTPTTENSAGGVYAITVGNANDIEMLEYVEQHDPNKPWKLPKLDSGVLECKWFLPVFQTAQLTIRPASGNLTVEPVVNSLPTDPATARAAIDANAQYKDSTKRAVTQANASLLDDMEEPNDTAYQFMLGRAQTDSATKGRSYAYHFLSLLNTADGNNVVTTAANKTVFVPYPASYKEGDPILMMYFGGYQRMPADDITQTKIEVIAEADITKLKTGFTFTTSGDMGAYIVAYGPQQSTPTPDPGPGPDTKPEEKPDTKPEEKPDTKPEEKPDTKPEEKPDTKPEEKPDTKPEEKPDTKPEEKPDTKPEETPDIKPEEKPDTKPEEKPDTKPEEKPDTKPEETPDIKPEETPETKPETKPDDSTPETPIPPRDELEDMVDEAIRHPEIIIRDKETLHAQYPDLDLEDLPVPLYWGPGFAVIQLSDGSLIVIDSSLLPLGNLPKTGTEPTADNGALWSVLLLLTAAAFVVVKPSHKHRNTK